MNEQRISLVHGEGLQPTAQLIKEVFLSRFSNPALDQLSDAASFDKLLFSCDSFTVNPIFFPGSDIGKLCVYGTVNDISVSAGIPLALSISMIVEEGFLKKDLERIAKSIQYACKDSGVLVVTGDFKVVEKGSADKIFISTSGIGRHIRPRVPLLKDIREKDRIIITHPIGEHGISVMLARKKMFDFKIKSDCRDMSKILTPLWKEFKTIRFMRDATRGGVAGVLNEIALGCNKGIRIYEDNLPIRKDVNSACDILGIDPLYLACEGSCVIVVPADRAAQVLSRVQKKEPHAAIVGEVDKSISGVVLQTSIGGQRIVDYQRALNIPRIC